MVIKGIAVRLYAWGGASKYHDYQLRSGEIVTLHETEFVYGASGCRYAKAGVVRQLLKERRAHAS